MTGALIEAQFVMGGASVSTVAFHHQQSISTIAHLYAGTEHLSGIALPPLTSSFAASLPQGFTPFAVSENAKTPYVNQWNFSIQHTLSASDLIEVDYPGTSAHRQHNRYDVDQCRVSATGFCDPATRPYPSYNNILYSETNGNLNYEAMSARYQHQVSRGLTIMANYTFSKAITDGWEGGGSTQSQIATCRSCDRGPTSYNSPHHFVVSAQYELPFERGRAFGGNWNRAADALAGGWQVTAILTLVTGTPFSVLALNRTGSNFTVVRANRTCDGGSANLRDNVRSNGLQWFDTSCFSAPAAGYFGNSGRGVLLGPGTNNWNIGLQKNFRFTEAARLELRGEFFNAFNHARFGNPDATVGDLNFGVISSASPPRLVQVAGRLVW